VRRFRRHAQKNVLLNSRSPQPAEVEETQIEDGVSAEADAGGVAELVPRIRSGDKQAEGELDQRYRRGMSIIIRRRVSDPTLVEDLVQETLRIALEAIRRGAVHEPRKLSGYIRGIAIKLILSYFRKAEFEKKFIPLEEVVSVASPERDPHEKVVEDERARIVRKVIAGLRMERDREILIRFYINGEEKGRICANLGLDSLQFDKVIFRALKRFKKLYEKISGSKKIYQEWSEKSVT